MNATLFRAAALATSLVLTGCGPGSPEEQLKSIQAAQAKNFPVTAQQKTELDSFVAAGREALAGGKKDEATEAFGKAMAILKIAEDAALFNSAD